MLLLAFDTATPSVTVALHDGTAVVAEESAVDGRRHGEILAVFIDKVLRSAGAGREDLTAVAVGTGPGPYTGLRAGLVTARVLASALAIRIDGVCSLDVIAAAACAEAARTEAARTEAACAEAARTEAARTEDGGTDFLVATDARRREVYWARYCAAGQRTDGPQVSRPADLPRGLPVAGHAALVYPELSDRPLNPAFPAAGQLAAISAARLSRGEPAHPAVPLYLRRPDAREPGKPKRVTP